MESIEKLVNQLDTLVTQTWEEYVGFHRELSQYMQEHMPDGKLGEKDVEPVNALIKKIQDVYTQLHPAFHFNIHRNEFVKNAVIGHQEFVNNLKKGGAKEEAEA